MCPPELTIISGGQTGADRAALDFAIREGLPHGGWCPRGRLAEDGPLPSQYQLQETESRRYERRTRRNVRDSDATLVLTLDAEPSGGTALTLDVTRQLGKPCLHLSRAMCASLAEAGAQIRQFIEQYDVERLNVAGPRASQQPEIGAFVDAVLSAALLEEREKS